jgi:energy-converting hydrogenase Eha subunit A
MLEDSNSVLVSVVFVCKIVVILLFKFMVVVLHLPGFPRSRVRFYSCTLSLPSVFYFPHAYSTIVFLFFVTVSCIGWSLVPCLALKAVHYFHASFSFDREANVALLAASRCFSRQLTHSNHSTNHPPTLSLDWETCTHQLQHI